MLRVVYPGLTSISHAADTLASAAARALEIVPEKPDVKKLSDLR